MAGSYKYDFNFKKDKTNRLIVFIFGFLMYCIAVALMSGFFTYKLTDNWEKSLNGQLTIEFPVNPDGTNSMLTEKQLGEVYEIARKTPGILRIKKLKESDILKILEPWLDSTAIPDDFPFPTLFDVETDRHVNVDLLDLTSKLNKVSQGVRIHNHANWYVSIEKISHGLFGFAMLLSVLILLTVCSTIIFITKKTLSQHREVVKILQLIGARDKYIASQFRKYYLSVGMKGALISVIFGVATIAGLSFLSGTYWLSLSNLKYLIIGLAVPLVVMLFIMLTAHSTVLYFLKSEDWID